jgi:hypothetical protein
MDRIFSFKDDKMIILLLLALPALQIILNNQPTMMSEEDVTGRSGGASKGAEERHG